MSGFDRTQFDADLDDIETYLGYLRGNELMWQTFHDFQLSMIDQVPWPAPFDYTSPCPDGRFQVPFDHYPLIEVSIPEGDAEALIRQRVEQLTDAMDQSWRNGQAWAAGVAGQARAVCEQFTEPFVPTLRGAMDLMQARVVNKLQVSANDDWANLGGAAAQWNGQFAGQFRNFYDNYNDVVARFGLFCSWINLGYALGTKIIAATQLGAGKFVTSLKKNLEGQLDHWADNGGDKPNDPSDWPAWVGDVAAVVQSTIGVASDIPVVGEVAGVLDMVGKTQTLMSDIDTLVGGGLLPEKKTYDAVMTAEEAYELFTTTLYDDHYQAFRTGMDQLDVGGAGSNAYERSISGQSILEMMRETKRRGDWGLPTIPATNLA
ncbi:hypothetical protein [Nocardioides abyssi]|uniref:WXG100 family type VII secretion target n=1 Tax=Nocardioides abyssi TaxID=3058370 RepID=A0ABT8EWP4_9ACTN|nr:hypothetical protein [Nocardioides abyssi]MDN4162509.1 hypothetical protein [Nocardioides abyssi]